MSAEGIHADVVNDIVDDEFVSIGGDLFVGEAIERFREFVPEDDETTIYYVYVHGSDDRLIGVLSVRELLNAPEDELVARVMHEGVHSLDGTQDVEVAARRFAELDFSALPVTDTNDKLVGVARDDDILDVVEEEATEDILKHAGFSFSDTEVSRSSAILESSIPRILRLRLPWLFVALAGGLLAGTVIEAYEDTLEAVVALAFFVPVIMDMGGNVGTQASTIFVRGLAVGHIDDRNAIKHFAREGFIGLLIGVIIGGVGAAVAYLWQIDEPYATELAIVVFVALVSVCIVASVVGYVIPWIMHKLGFDPAAASDPLITTVKDVSALVIYFGLAAVLLAELL